MHYAFVGIVRKCKWTVSRGLWLWTVASTGSGVNLDISSKYISSLILLLLYVCVCVCVCLGGGGKGWIPAFIRYIVYCTKILTCLIYHIVIAHGLCAIFIGSEGTYINKGFFCLLSLCTTTSLCSDEFYLSFATQINFYKIVYRSTLWKPVCRDINGTLKTSFFTDRFDITITQIPALCTAVSRACRL